MIFQRYQKALLWSKGLTKKKCCWFSLEVLFFWFDSLRPINNLWRVFLGWTGTKLDSMFLLKDTTQRRRWGLNPLPHGLKSSMLPLSHCAPYSLEVSQRAPQVRWLIGRVLDIMGESSKFPKSWMFEIQILKLAVCLQSVNNFHSLNGQLPKYEVKIIREAII